MAAPLKKPATRRAAVATLATLAAGVAWPRALTAAERTPFPVKPVRIVVPYSVGVGPDVVARAVAAHLAKRWDQTVWVDNKPGASGIVAFGEVRRTPPDGHTIFLADTATLAVNPLLHATLPYDPARDLLPLTLLFRATFLVWTGGRGRFASLQALLDAAREKPGSVSYASLGHGHASQVAVESFAHAAGIRMLHVPFKDAGSLMTAVVSGECDITAFSLNTMNGLYQQGKLRPLAVAARQRLPALPAVPTLPEAGGPAVEMHPWAALVAVAGTPAPVLAQLEHELAAALAAPEVRQMVEQAGFELTPSTPQALRDRMNADMAQYAPLVQEGRVVRQ